MVIKSRPIVVCLAVQQCLVLAVDSICVQFHHNLFKYCIMIRRPKANPIAILGPKPCGMQCKLSYISVDHFRLLRA